MISIILPFKYIGDRWPLFEKVVDHLYNLTKDCPDFELCIHESSESRFLTDEWLDSRKIRYLYTEWNETFHRSWNLNIAARYLASGSLFIFHDGDILVEPDFIDKVRCLSVPSCWGWSTLHYLTHEATQHYLNTGIIRNEFKFSREPHFWDCAGGINIIKRDIFFGMAGWPEEFRGVYGGPDNLLIIKLQALGYHTGPIPVTAFHLEHVHRTEPIFGSVDHITQKNRRTQILNDIMAFSSDDWKQYIYQHQGFGDISLTKKLEFRGI